MFDENVTVAEFFSYNLSQFEVGEPSDALITNDLIGLEIELENAARVKLPRTHQWSIERDNSLRGEDAREFRFDVPLRGLNAVNHMKMLHDGCQKNPPTISKRCSVHVHVNVADMTKQQLMQMVLMYMIFETPVFKTYASGRIDNHFCLPFNNCLDLMPTVQWLHNGWPEFANNFNHPEVGRYCAFNLRSIFKFGTVEFRHHAGEWDFDKLREWVNVCLSFKRMALAPTNLRETFFEASHHGFDRQIEQYFPHDVVRHINDYYREHESEGALFHDVVEGVRRAQFACSPRIRL